jgi:hypothetical protein
MEPEGSLPHLKETTNYPYSEPLIQSMLPHPTSWSSVFILSSHLCLGLPSGLLPVGFSTKTLYSSLPHTCYMPCPSHSSRFDHPNSVWWAVQIIKLLIMQFSPLPCHLVPPWVRGLWSVTVNLLLDVSLCRVRLSHTEALYKETFDPLMHSNYILYIPQAVTLRTCTFCTNIGFMCFMWLLNTLILIWQWSPHVPPQPQQLSTRLHDVTSQCFGFSTRRLCYIMRVCSVR